MKLCLLSIFFLINTSTLFANEIRCALVKSEIENSFIVPQEPITININEAAYENLKVIHKGRLRSLDINSISLNLAGNKVHFLLTNTTNSRLVLESDEQKMLFYIKPTNKRLFKGLIIATNLREGDDVVQYNVSCKY